MNGLSSDASGLGLESSTKTTSSKPDHSHSHGVFVIAYAEVEVGVDASRYKTMQTNGQDYSPTVVCCVCLTHCWTLVI